MRVLISPELKRGRGFELALGEGALAVRGRGELNAHSCGWSIRMRMRTRTKLSPMVDWGFELRASMQSVFEAPVRVVESLQVARQ